MITALKASPISVPAMPKREVKSVATGEAIPTAITLGRSRTVCFWCSSIDEDTLQSLSHKPTEERGVNV
jgi:hypothetical protein